MRGFTVFVKPALKTEHPLEGLGIIAHYTVSTSQNTQILRGFNQCWAVARFGGLEPPVPVWIGKDGSGTKLLLF